MNRSLIIVDPSLRDFVGHHYEYDRAICVGAKAAGLQPLVLGHAQALPEIAEALPFRAAFSLDMWQLYPGEAGLSREAGAVLSNKAFQAELTASIAAAAPPPGSIIFGHMISWRNLLAWARFALQVAARDEHEVVLLLRYQAEFYSDNISTKAFRLLERAANSAKIRIVTDSERLSSHIARLTSLPVGVVPIPHVPELEGNSSAGRMKDAPLRVTSLGNARDEKGILELLQAVRIIEAAGQAHRFHFDLQVNDPAADITPAIEAFAAENWSNVTLHREALNSDAYYALLARSDVVALPYWRSIYEARTSGVFLEAIASGKPVLCTDDTWMSDELLRSGAGFLVKSADASDLVRQLLRAEEQYASLRAKALEGLEKIREHFNPDAAIRAILGDFDKVESPTLRWNAAVLYPWGDARRAHSGASLRTNLLARFLAENGANVRLLQNSTDIGETRGAIKFESYPVDARLAESTLSKGVTRVAKSLMGADDGKDLFLRMFMQPEWDRAFAIRLNEIVRWADVVFLEYPFWSAKLAAICRQHGKPLVLTTYDVLAGQIPDGTLQKITRAAERRAMAAVDIRYSVSEEDRKTFQDWGVETKVIPHPIDVSSMRIRSPTDTRELLANLVKAPNDTEHYFLFIGSAYPPNVAAAKSVREIARLYAEQNPDSRVQFIVAGGCLAPERDVNFTALGRVDDLTLRLLYEHCSAALVPLREGTGASLKTIEAFGAGRTVIGTAFAFRGLDVKDGVHCLIEETNEKLVDAVTRVVKKPAILGKLAKAGMEIGDRIDFHNAFSPYAAHIPKDRQAHSEEAHPSLLHQQLVAYSLSLAEAARSAGLHEMSEACLEHVTRIDPKNGAAMLGLAAARLREGEIEAGRKLIDDALIHGAPAIDAMRMRIAIGMQAGDDVQEDVRRLGHMFLLQTWSQEAVNAMREHLWKEFGKGERQEIVDLLGPILQFRPDYPDPGFWFLHVHGLLDVGGNLTTVAHHFGRAAELGFDPMWANFHLARVLARLDRTAEAASALAKALAVATPENVEMIRDVAIPLLWNIFHAGEYDEGGAFARSLLSFGIDTPEIHFLLGECLKNGGGSQEEALAEFSKASASGDMAFWVHLNRGALYASMGDQARARTDYLKAYSVASDEATSATARAHAYPTIQDLLQSRQFEQVEQLCTALIEGWANDAWTHYVLAEALNGSGRDYLLAAQHYARAAELGYERYWCLFNRSRAYARLGLAEEALQDLVEAANCFSSEAEGERLAPLLSEETHVSFGAGSYEVTAIAAAAWCKAQPSNGEAHYLLAESLLILNRDLDIAEEHYTLALEAGHNAHWTHFNRAQLYRRVSQFEKAVADLLRALELSTKEDRSDETANAACDLAIDLTNHGMITEARKVLLEAQYQADLPRTEELLKSLDDLAANQDSAKDELSATSHG